MEYEYDEEAALSAGEAERENDWGDEDYDDIHPFSSEGLGQD